MMINMLLMVLVIGVVVVALFVDLAALLGWLLSLCRRRDYATRHYK